MSAGRYGAIADQLRERIREGEWVPGELLPRMVDLAEEFGVNRNTIARAVAELEAEGLVWAVPRRGTIVRPGGRRRITRGNVVKRNRRHMVDGKEVAGGYSFPAASGTESWPHHITPFASLEILDNERIAEMLKVPAGSPILRRRRVTGPDGEPPFQMSNTWIHPRGVADAPRVAEQGAGPGGWLDRLEEVGHGPIKWVEYYRARTPSQDEAANLHIPISMPIQEIVRVGYSAKDEKPIEVTEIVIPSDRVEMMAHLVRDESAEWPHPDTEAGPDSPVASK